MIKLGNGFKAQYNEGASYAPLPAGTYVGAILGSKIVDTSYGSKLELCLDVTEGEYEHFFKQRWDADATLSDRKWKGVLRLNIPRWVDEDKDKWDQNTFNSAIGAIQESNDGFTFDGNENSLKGKAVGFVVRERDWQMNGKTGTTTEIGKLAPVAKVREGAVKLMKKRELSEKDKQALAAFTAPVDDGSGYSVVTEDDLPF